MPGNHQQPLAPQKDKQADFISVVREDSTTAFEVVLALQPEIKPVSDQPSRVTCQFLGNTEGRETCSTTTQGCNRQNPDYEKLKGKHRGFFNTQITSEGKMERERTESKSNKWSLFKFCFKHC